MKKYLPFIVILIFNFLGLYLGGLATNPGVQSEWYQNLNQAPWTPPGYVFGIVWTLIGITWSVLGQYLWRNRPDLFRYYIVSWILNLIWNPFFFTFHLTGISGIIIIYLSITIFFILEQLRKNRGAYISFWGYLYFFWLMIATSLNWYIYFMN
jgi:tryptophan-rich sensory protein